MIQAHYTFIGYDFRTLPIPRLGNNNPRVAEIQRAVARRFDTPFREMFSPRRGRDVARPRQVAMYLCRELTARSMPEIGRMFGGRDHTTVLHAIRRITLLRQIDPELDADVRALERELAA
jgi:chromosomal replication initiator protein